MLSHPLVCYKALVKFWFLISFVSSIRLYRLYRDWVSGDFGQHMTLSKDPEEDLWASRSTSWLGPSLVLARDVAWML